MTYIYDRGENRTKHQWNHNYAGFVTQGKAVIGKCDASIDPTTAQGLLNGGVEYRDDPGAEHPDEVYNVHKGVPYKAVVTEYGKSYHGYPWKGLMPEEIYVELEERADGSGYANEFKKWCKQHSEMRQ